MCRNFLRAIVVLGVIGFSLQVNAQPRTTYFKFFVNGSPDSTMTQGDDMAWECDCGLGDTLTGELWLDLNANYVIDGDDKLWPECPFRLIDGDISWEQGPADSSAVPDGIFYCDLSKVFSSFSLAPTNYVMKVTNLIDLSTAESRLLVHPHPSPPVTVSGTVSIEGITPPNSMLYAISVSTSMGEKKKGSQNTVEKQMVYWSSITDSFGEYTLNLPSAGTYEIGPEDNILPYIHPPYANITVSSGDTTGIDFLYGLPEAIVYGTVKDDRDSMLPFEVSVWYYNETTGEGDDQRTSNGSFFFGMNSGEIRLGVWSDDLAPNYLTPNNYEWTLNIGDSLEKNFKCYRTDTTIFGLVTENDQLPSKSYRFNAQNDTFGYTNAYSDSATGLFELRVTAGTGKPNGIIYWVHLEEWDTPLPEGFGFETGNGWQAHPGDTVYVQLVSYKGSVSGTLNVDWGDPVPNFEHFTATLFDHMTGEPKTWSQVDSNGTYKVPAPAGSWDIGLWNPDEWTFSPGRIESVVVDTEDVPGNDFTVNYGHCTLSGILHGLFYVPENTWIHADGDSSWPHGYFANGEVHSSDSSYSLKLCDAKWTVRAPWIEGYLSPPDTTFTISDSDSSMIVDFHYTPVLYLEWTGTTGFEEDGVHPDTGVDGGTFEFQVKWTSVSNDSPDVHQVWIDLNDDLEYGSAEQFPMTEVDTNDNTYNDGKNYTFTTTIDRAGDGILNYRFYFRNWTGSACGYPTMDHSVVVMEPGVETEKVPAITILYPPTPNPSAGAINIRYSTAKLADVSLKIYDVTGRVVKELVNSQKNPGTYTLKWNWKSDTGTKLANGIYFCKFESGDYQSTKKLILLR